MTQAKKVKYMAAAMLIIYMIEGSLEYESDGKRAKLKAGANYRAGSLRTTDIASL